MALSSKRKILTGCLATVFSWLATSCSVVEPGKTVQSDTITAISELPPAWRFSRKLLITTEQFPALQSAGIQQAEFNGRCQFQPDVLKWIHQGKRGLLLPVLKLQKDLTLSPDLGVSARLYKVMDDHFRLSSAADSLAFYHILLSSIEHTCPANMTRNIESCQFQKWMSFAGFNSGSELYDIKRIRRWLDINSDVNYLLMDSAALYNSSAMLNVRYSSHSRVITEQSDAVKVRMIKPHLGKTRYDWVQFQPDSEPVFKSYGFCELTWPDLIKSNSANFSSDGEEADTRVDGAKVKELNQFSKLMLQKLIEFMNSAAEQIKKL